MVGPEEVGWLLCRALTRKRILPEAYECQDVILGIRD